MPQDWVGCRTGPIIKSLRYGHTVTRLFQRAGRGRVEQRGQLFQRGDCATVSGSLLAHNRVSGARTVIALDQPIVNYYTSRIAYILAYVKQELVLSRTFQRHHD